MELAQPHEAGLKVVGRLSQFFLSQVSRLFLVSECRIKFLALGITI